MNVLPLRLSTLLVAGVFFALPLLAHAQQDDLQATIRTAILQDPRAAGMSAQQLDLLVSALTEKAQQQNVTSQDIVWRPMVVDASAPDTTDFCPPFPQLLCTMNESFGFNGPDYIIPAWLASSALLLMLLVALRRHHARPVAVPATAPAGY